MITVISGTIRPKNKTSLVAKHYVELLKSKGQNVEFLNIESLPKDFVFNNDTMGTKNPEFSSFVEKYIIPAQKFVILTPEYNGSFPGAIKAFFDGVNPDDFREKKVALVGVASGRSGNARGMDQLTSIYNYTNMPVLPYKVTMPSIYLLMNEEGVITDEKMKVTIEKQMDAFIDF
jgi:NAD(P)H-dependent FMN reductase